MPLLKHLYAGTDMTAPPAPTLIAEPGPNTFLILDYTSREDLQGIIEVASSKDFYFDIHSKSKYRIGQDDAKGGAIFFNWHIDLGGGMVGEYWVSPGRTIDQKTRTLLTVSPRRKVYTVARADLGRALEELKQYKPEPEE
jgi:hypothetical protein